MRKYNKLIKYLNWIANRRKIIEEPLNTDFVVPKEKCYLILKLEKFKVESENDIKKFNAMVKRKYRIGV